MSEVDQLGLPKQPRDITPGLGIIIARVRKVNPSWTHQAVRNEAHRLLNESLTTKSQHRKRNTP